ncbi:hypothetical protein AZ044_000028 [Pluralibacter gergoviae]|nr:hypothetical protein AZ044_000028 [Pluralibacter gergoviae]
MRLPSLRRARQGTPAAQAMR